MSAPEWRREWGIGIGRIGEARAAVSIPASLVGVACVVTGSENWS